jgi:hypothetical protein
MFTQLLVATLGETTSDAYIKLATLIKPIILYVGRGCSAGIVTRYGLDGLAIESRWGRDFPHPSSLLYNGYRVFPGGKAAGTWR